MPLQVNKVQQAVQSVSANRGQHMGSQAFAAELQSASAKGSVPFLVANNIQQPIFGEVTPHSVEVGFNGLCEFFQNEHAELQSRIASGAISVSPKLLAAINEKMSYFSKDNLTQKILPAYNDVMFGEGISDALKNILPSVSKTYMVAASLNGITEKAYHLAYLISYALNGVPVANLTNRKLSTLVLTEEVNLLASYELASIKDLKIFDLSGKSADIVKACDLMPGVLAEADYLCSLMKISKLLNNAWLYGTSSFSQQNYTKYAMNDVLIQNTPDGDTNHISGFVPFSVDTGSQFDNSKGKLPAPNSVAGKTMGYMTIDAQNAYSMFTLITDFALNNGNQFESLIEFSSDEERAFYVEKAKSYVSDGFFLEIKQNSKRLTFGTVLSFTPGHYDGTSSAHMIHSESCECVKVELRSYGVTPDGALAFLPNLFGLQETKDALTNISVSGYDLKYRTAADVQTLLYFRARIANINNNSFSFAVEDDDSAKVGEELLDTLL